MRRSAVAVAFVLALVTRRAAADPVDTTPPPPPVVTAPANITNDNTPTYSGTAEPGSLVTFYVDGFVFASDYANASGDVSLTEPIPLADGPHTLRLRARDAAGNNSPDSATHTFFVDTIPPTAPVVLTPANGATTSNSTPPYTGTAEPGATITFVVDGVAIGVATTDASGNVALTPITPLSDGQHMVKLFASDEAGNTSPDSNTNTFTVDTTAPPAPMVLTPANGLTIDDATPEITGSTQADVTVTVYIDGASIGNVQADASGHVSFDVTTPLEDGMRSVTMRASDAVGNTSGDGNTNVFIVDTTAPIAPVVTSPTDGATIATTTPTIEGTAEAGATVEVSVDGASIGTTTANDGAFTLAVTSPLSAGEHAVIAVATDALGHVSEDSTAVAFTVAIEDDAGVDDGGVQTDGGVIDDAGTDASDDGGEEDAGPDGSDGEVGGSDGCGCTTAGSGGGAQGLLGLTCVVAMLVARRRR